MKGFRLSLVEHIRIESWIMYLELCTYGGGIGPGLKFDDSGCTDHMDHVMNINMRDILPAVG